MSVEKGSSSRAKTDHLCADEGPQPRSPHLLVVLTVLAVVAFGLGALAGFTIGFGVHL